MSDAEEEKTRSLEEAGMGRSPFEVLSAMRRWDMSEGHFFLLLLRAHHSGRAVASPVVGNVVIFDSADWNKSMWSKYPVLPRNLLTSHEDRWHPFFFVDAAKDKCLKTMSAS